MFNVLSKLGDEEDYEEYIKRKDKEKRERKEKKKKDFEDWERGRKNYIYYWAMEALFIPRTMLIPYDEFVKVRTSDLKVLRKYAIDENK